jgi:hypothetical protein
MSKIEVDAIDKQSGSTLTLGGSGTAVTLASGATQSGFGRTGTVDWQTGSIKTSTFTAANGEGYFANTSGGAFTMNLPAGTAGNIVSVVDYTNTFQTNALTITPNGSQKLGGAAAPQSLSTEGQSVTFVYVDDTEGWKTVQDSTSNVVGNPFLVATGGTITEDGNFKIHTFTGPGTFTVSKISSTAAENTVGYLVIAGGGAGAHSYAGGGGAGGYREGRNVPIDNFTASPLVANAPTNAVTVTSQAYPITVGAGGTGPSSPGDAPNGNPSIFSTITSAGGGGGGVNQPDTAPSGGSGGGGGGDGGAGVPLGNGGAGNTPPVSPPQGQNGGNGQAQGGYGGAGGGGGAGGAGVNATNTVAGAGGNGVSSSITGASVARGGGGGGGIVCQPDSQGGNPGPGGGGKGGGGGAANPTGTAGTVNTGGGGGAGGNSPSSDDGLNGGSGIVIIRYKFQ